MAKDASLDDFLSDDSEEEREDDTDVEEPSFEGRNTAGTSRSETGDADGANEADDGVESATTTYSFTPTTGQCDACGSNAPRRWRDDDGLVCPDCKNW